MTQLIDNGDYITLLVGHLTRKEFINEVFGVESIAELRQLETFPTFVPAETPRGDLLSRLIEQIKYERTDGPQLPVRIVVMNDAATANQVMTDCFVEETQDSSTEFAYNDFLSMLHKRVRSKTTSKS